MDGESQLGERKGRCQEGEDGERPLSAERGVRGVAVGEEGEKRERGPVVKRGVDGTGEDLPERELAKGEEGKRGEASREEKEEEEGERGANTEGWRRGVV